MSSVKNIHVAPIFYVVCPYAPTSTPVYFPLFRMTHGTQDSLLTKATVIDLLCKCRVPVAVCLHRVVVECFTVYRQESIQVAALTFMYSHISLHTQNAMMWYELTPGVLMRCLVPLSMMHVYNGWSLCAVLL